MREPGRGGCVFLGLPPGPTPTRPGRAPSQPPSSLHLAPTPLAAMVVSLASAGGAAKIYCVNGGGSSNKNAAAWLEAKLGKTRKRRGGQGGTGGEGEIRLIQVS